ncbi:MAG: hypothetical protein WCS96_14860 [Victivallales bacterium]|jgi:hypothetical protein
MEMKRRDFLERISGLALGAVFISGFCWASVNARDVCRKFSYAGKIKKYPGKIKPTGDEINTEGEWNG